MERAEAGGGFKLVDPDGLLAEAEYDLGVSCARTLSTAGRRPCGRARWLARRCGLDESAIWEWGVVERVSTGLLCTSMGLQPVAARCSPPLTMFRGIDITKSYFPGFSIPGLWRLRMSPRRGWLNSPIRADPSLTRSQTSSAGAAMWTVTEPFTEMSIRGLLLRV